MKEGCLPVKYLGVPLCTKKLSIYDCGPMIQQVKERISSWSARSLSFAGRLQLIKTVIAGIANFWCSSFSIPKAVINKINSLCSIYLWKGKSEGRNSARVAWEDVTRTKKAGGLGIKDLVCWNKACLLRLIWLLFFRAGSIWVAWFKNEVLNGNLSNFWTRKTNQKLSWLDNKLLKLKGEVFTWIKLRLGNGRSCRFWTDNWSDFESLDSYLITPGCSLLGIRRNATVDSLYRAGNWNLPPARSEAQLTLQVFLTTIHLSQEEDYYEWCPNGVHMDKFQTAQVYDLLRSENQVVPWESIVWIKGGVPKQSFLVWLMMLNRSPTRDRIAKWGLNTPTSCLLCNTGLESRDHLYFICPFAWTVWSTVSVRCDHIPHRNWESQVNALQTITVSKHKKRLTLLAWQTVIHTIWRERNSRLHRSIFSSEDALLREIDLTVRNRIAGLRDSNPVLSSAMIQQWY